jgi:hypothetical protein
MSASIFKEWTCDHAQYTSVFDTLKEEIERVLQGSTPIVFPLLGDSRAGKSALLKDIEVRFSDHVSPSGHRRVMVVSMPSAASIEALAVRIIQTILGDIRVKGKTYQILNQARETMKAAGILVLLVDETNHLVEKRSTERAQSKENRQTADWFKELGDLSGISVVVTGLSHVSRMYSDNDQLENRGLVGARINPYAWSVQGDRIEFQNTVNAGLSLMQANGWSIEVPSDLLIRVVYFGGGGYIGKVMDLLVRIEEIGNKHKHLDAQLLGRAYKDKYKLDSNGDPLLMKSIDDIMLNAAHQRALERAIRSGRGR